MGFVQRAFTPPGTGGAEAQAIMANAAAQQSTLKAQQVAAAPTPPTLPAGPKQPQMFQPGQSPGAKQRAQVTASSMLGAAASAGQQAKKSVLGA